MKKGWMVIPIVAILINCAPRRTVEKPEPMAPAPPDTLVEPTPITSPEPIIIFEEDIPLVEEQLEQPQVVSSEGKFRVQVFATVDRLKAEAILDAIKEKEDIPVYIVEEKGVFKVRIGNFKTRIQAEGFRDYIRRRGYPDAFVVEMKH